MDPLSTSGEELSREREQQTQSPEVFEEQKGGHVARVEEQEEEY